MKLPPSIKSQEMFLSFYSNFTDAFEILQCFYDLGRSVNELKLSMSFTTFEHFIILRHLKM